MATSTIKGRTETTIQQVTVTTAAEQVGALNAQLQGNILLINAVLRFNGQTFANNDTIMTITGYKASKRTDCWALPESGPGRVKAVIMNNSSNVIISEVGNGLMTGFNGYYDFNMVIPVVPA